MERLFTLRWVSLEVEDLSRRLVTGLLGLRSFLEN